MQDAVDSKHLKTSVELLKDSFHEICLSDETEFQTSVQSDVRYKLLIDPSEDDSLTRILFTFDLISDRKSKVRKYVCSDLAGSSYSEVSPNYNVAPHKNYNLFLLPYRCIQLQKFGILLQRGIQLLCSRLTVFMSAFMISSIKDFDA